MEAAEMYRAGYDRQAVPSLSSSDDRVTRAVFLAAAVAGGGQTLGS